MQAMTSASAAAHNPAVEQPALPSVRTSWRALRGEDDDLALVSRRLAKVLTLTSVASAFIGGIEAMFEHYRGSFNQWSMWTPIGCSAALLATSAAALTSHRAFRRWMPAASWLMIGDGLAGVFYHVRGIHRRPGGLSEPIFNITTGPPFFAPLILSGAGAIGLLALLLDRTAEAQLAARRASRSNSEAEPAAGAKDAPKGGEGNGHRAA